MTGVPLLTMLIHDHDAVAPPLTPIAVAPYAAPTVLSFVPPHAKAHLAESGDTLTPLRSPRLREEARDAITDFAGEHIRSLPSLHLKKPANVKLTALQEIGIPRRPQSN